VCLLSAAVRGLSWWVPGGAQALVVRSAGSTDP